MWRTAAASCAVVGLMGSLSSWPSYLLIHRMRVVRATLYLRDTAEMLPSSRYSATAIRSNDESTDATPFFIDC